MAGLVRRVCEIGEGILWKWAGLVRRLCGSWLDWSGENMTASWIGEETLYKLAGLMGDCGSGWDW